MIIHLVILHAFTIQVKHNSGEKRYLLSGVDVSDFIVEILLNDCLAGAECTESKRLMTIHKNKVYAVIPTNDHEHFSL